MARKVLFVLMTVASLLSLCSECEGDLDKAEDFLNTNPVSEKIHDAVTDAAGEIEGYVEEMASDAIGMTEKFVPSAEDLPQVSPEASQEARDGVMEVLEDVGQAVLDADAAAKELQACFEMCDAAFKDNSGHKTENNILCVAQCKSK